MRLILCTLAMVVLLAGPSHAQTGGGPYAAYVELAGNGFVYSVNGELPIARNRTVRIGGMLLPGLAAAGTASINQLFGRGSNYLVLGAGVTFGGGDDINLNAGTATVGYRYMRPGGLFFQFAATPFFHRHGVFPWTGISIGKSY